MLNDVVVYELVAGFNFSVPFPVSSLIDNDRLHLSILFENKTEIDNSSWINVMAQNYSLYGLAPITD